MKLREKIYRTTIGYWKLLRKYNSLKLETEILEEYIKDDLYDAYKNSLNQNQEIISLERENKRLRSKNKELKKELREKSDKKSKTKR